jgi:4-hydroxy-3-methylbut-2-enyl diphosphate reductase
VVNNLKQKGAIFVEELSQIPDKSIVIFSAHGVSQAVCKEASQRDFKIFDATCPLVTKVHLEVARYSKEGRECILIGHQGHPEVEGTKGQYHNSDGGIYLIETLQQAEQLMINHPDFLAYVTQTTLSLDETADIVNTLSQRFPKMIGPKKNDICYATQNRQDIVKELAQQCDLFLVVGSANSSNSNRLKEDAMKYGCEAYLIDDASEIEELWLKNKQCIGVTAGASAPEILVENVCQRLKQLGVEYSESVQGAKEDIIFPLPKQLKCKKCST